MFVGSGSWSRLPPSASVGMFSYQADLVLAICYLQVRQAPPRPPTHPPTATFLLHESLEGRPTAGNSLSPWSSIVDSVCHSVLTRLWWQAQLRSPARRRTRAETRKGRGWEGGRGGSGLLSLLHRLRLVLSEQSLPGPSALSGTLLPGLNNECAGLPLLLGALISSQGPVFTHEREIRNLPSCGALLFFLFVSFGK